MNDYETKAKRRVAAGAGLAAAVEIKGAAVAAAGECAFATMGGGGAAGEVAVVLLLFRPGWVSCLYLDPSDGDCGAEQGAEFPGDHRTRYGGTAACRGDECCTSVFQEVAG